MNKQDKPNAFLFIAFIDGQHRTCLCPRINDQWSEKDMFYITEDTSIYNGILHDSLFSVVFVKYEEDITGTGVYKISHDNSNYLKSTTSTAQNLYINGQFFPTVERGYQRFYEQQSEQTSG